MVWTLLRAASGAVSTTLGNSFVGWADRQARQRRFRRPLRADLLLALLATRLAAVAYVETEGELRAALNSPAIGTNMHGGLKLLHFRKQKSEQTTEGEGLHPQWFLCRGAQPWWTFKDGPRAGQSASHNTESDGGDGGGRDDGESTNGRPQQDALYLVFRGTWSATDVIRDLCVEPEQFGVSTSGCAPPTAPPSTRPCASTVCVRMRAPVYVCLCAWRSMHADMPPASYFPSSCSYPSPPPPAPACRRVGSSTADFSKASRRIRSCRPPCGAPCAAVGASTSTSAAIPWAAPLLSAWPRRVWCRTRIASKTRA
jgi:hypothetical protein